MMQKLYLLTFTCYNATIKDSRMKTFFYITMIIGLLINPIITMLCFSVYLYVKAIKYSLNNIMYGFNDDALFTFNNINYSTPYASFNNKTVNEGFFIHAGKENWDGLAANLSCPEVEKVFLPEDAEEQFRGIIKHSL